MTVAPELPPALDRRSAETGRPARAARRRTPATHPTGAVAPRSTPTSTAPSAPAPGRGIAHLRVAGRLAPVETPIEQVPGPRLPSRTDLDPAAPGAPAAPAEPRQRAIVERRPEPGAGTAGEHHPAVPGRLCVTGTRVVRPAVPPMRLTVRGRLLVGLLAALAVVAGMLLVTSRVDALREPASPVPASAPAAVVVEPGESLWTIAERVAPDRDPRTVVDQLRRINRLPSADVQAGQRILLRAP